MEIVEKRRLLAGQTFATKEIVWMQIAEEANRRRIRVKTELSNRFNLYVSGENFRVQVNFREKTKWKVNVAAVWEHDPGSNTPITNWLASAEGADKISKV